MNISTGGNIYAIRQAIIDTSPVPIGTVPIYPAVQMETQLEEVAELYRGLTIIVRDRRLKYLSAASE